MMQINLNLPEEIARAFGADAQTLEKAALEGLALEGVRSGRLSRGQVRRLLGFPTRYEVDGFLKAHGVAVQESMDEVQQDSDLVLALGRR
jgi:predicted N-acetyltransferase YhbS